MTKMPSLTDKFFLGKNRNLKKSWGFLKAPLNLRNVSELEEAFRGAIHKWRCQLLMAF